MRLKLKNFQSISDAELEFQKGVTMIVGASNSGKSALVRGLQSAYTNNTEAKDHIQEGQTETSIQIEKDKHSFEWGRTVKESYYTIDGQLHQKVGRSSYLELYPKHNLALDHDDNILNIQDEWDILFPFSRSSAETFKLFEHTFKINNSTDVLKHIKELEKDNKAELVAVESRINKLDNLKTSIDTLLDLDIETQLSDLLKTLTELDAERDRIIADCEEFDRLLQNLKPLREISSLEKSNALQESEQLIRDSSIVDSNIRLYRADIPTIAVQDLQPLTNILADSAWLVKNERLLNPTKESLEIPSMPEFSAFRDADNLESLLKKYKATCLEISAVSQEIEGLNTKRAKVGFCPLCNSNIDRSSH